MDGPLAERDEEHPVCGKQQTSPRVFARVERGNHAEDHLHLLEPRTAIAAAFAQFAACDCEAVPVVPRLVVAEVDESVGGVGRAEFDVQESTLIAPVDLRNAHHGLRSRSVGSNDREATLVLLGHQEAIVR